MRNRCDICQSLYSFCYVGFMDIANTRHFYAEVHKWWDTLQHFLIRSFTFSMGKCRSTPWFECQNSTWKFGTKKVFIQKIQLILFSRKIHSNMANFHTVDVKELSLKKSFTHPESFHSLFLILQRS